jgi:uncharacterized protein (TIGR04255 family)
MIFMSDEEKYFVYSNPTVKKVVFQIKFSNRFSIENNIGKIQEKIIDKFPESEYSFRRNLVFTNVGSGIKNIQIPEMGENEPVIKKTWQFSSEKKKGNHYILNLQTNSLSITSEQHKSYYPSEYGEGFKDIIKFVLDAFFDYVSVKKIKRMGLRYIDEAPIPSLVNDEFAKWYNTSFPLHKYSLERMNNIHFRTEINFDKITLIYQEFLHEENGKIKYYLDFDAFTTEFDAEHLFDLLDDLHKIIHSEWDQTLKEPVKAWMKNETKKEK